MAKIGYCPGCSEREREIQALKDTIRAIRFGPVVGGGIILADAVGRNLQLDRRVDDLGDWLREYRPYWNPEMPEMEPRLPGNSRSMRINPMSGEPIPKKKRKVSKYQREFGRQLKKLKKKHPRTSIGILMKKAHRATKKALR